MNERKIIDRKLLTDLAKEVGLNASHLEALGESRQWEIVVGGDMLEQLAVISGIGGSDDILIVRLNQISFALMSNILCAFKSFRYYCYKLYLTMVLMIHTIKKIIFDADMDWNFAPAYDLLPSDGINGFRMTSINDKINLTKEQERIND